MRVLKYAILGLLRKGELSGYDITSYFKEELSTSFGAPSTARFTLSSKS
nr:hypothetical protein P5621_04750 [Bacillus subtilis]